MIITLKGKRNIFKMSEKLWNLISKTNAWGWLGVNSVMGWYEVIPMAELLCTYSMFRPQMNSAFLIGWINLIWIQAANRNFWRFTIRTEIKLYNLLLIHLQKF